MREMPTLSEGLGKKKEDSVCPVHTENPLNGISPEELNKLNPVLYRLIMAQMLGYND